MQLPVDISTVKGFLADHEGAALYHYAKQVAHLGPILEIGSYCGKSTIYIAQACRETNNAVFSVDHHRGSEEHQPGEEYHDSELMDSKSNQFDSLREFRHNIERAGLTDQVIPLVAPSKNVARWWNIPLAMVFIDGGHSMTAALTDYRCWVRHILPGGILAIHDVFTNANEGGRPPFRIWNLARASSEFVDLALYDTLAIQQRITI